MQSIIVNNPRTSYFVGGSEMVSMEHAKAMHRLGYKVTFLTINPESIGKKYSIQYEKFKNNYSDSITFKELNQDAKALPVYDIEPGENRTRWNTEALFYNRPLFRYLLGSESHKVMLSYFNIDALVVPTEKIENNIIYLSGVPGDESVFRHSFLSSYDKLFAITDETKNYWAKYTQEPISVMHTGVDINRFKPRNKHNDKVEILFAGRLIERKGCDILLRSVSELSLEILSRINLNIIGNGPQKKILEDLVVELHLEDYVTFIGAVDDPERYMSVADICIFPSSRGEGLQGVILEAMASGASTIAGNTAINNELLAGGRGLTVDTTTVGKLRDGIIRLVKDPSLRLTMGEESRRYVTKHFNWDKLTMNMLRDIK